MALTDDLKKLIADATREEDAPYVSIFMTIHPNETNIQLDKSQYKNLVTAAQRAFTATYPERDWTSYQDEFDLIGSERSLGRAGYQGMAVIASKGHVFRYYLTIQPEDASYVSDNLYVLPIIKDSQYNQNYDLLKLEKTTFSLYRIRDGVVTPVKLSPVAPDTFEKAAKLMTASDHSAIQADLTSGQYPNNNEDIARYFKVVDQYVRQNYSLDEHVPVVLMAADEVQKSFRDISKNGMLEPTIRITKVPAKLEQDDLIKIKDDITAQYSQQIRTDILQKLDDARSGNREATGLDNVVSAATEGRIRQLLLRDNTFEPGIINLDMQVDTKSAEAAKHNLLNDIAVTVLAFGGQVYILDDDDMPLGQSAVGLLRGKVQA